MAARFAKDASEKRTTVTRLRWLLILALAYLLLFHTDKALTMQGLLAFVAFYMASNLVVGALPESVFNHPWFDRLLILFDTVAVSGALIFTQLPVQNLYLFFFLIILLTTLGKGLKGIVANGVIIIGVYSFFLFQSSGFKAFSQAGTLLQIPFLVICTVFYGVLVDREQQRHQIILEQLRSASEAIVVHLKLKEVLNRILQAVTGLLDTEIAYVLLLDKDGLRLKLAHGVGIRSDLIGTHHQPSDAGWAGRVLQQGRPALLKDTAADPWLAGLKPDHPSASSVMAVPLRTGNKTIGLLGIERWTRSRRFSSQDLEIVGLFALSVSTAIEHAQLFEDIQAKARELKEAHFETVLAFGEALETRDLYTGGHIHRVLEYATALAKKLNLPPDEIETLQYVAMLHDTGKIGIPDHILHSTGPLSEEHWVLMKGHSAKGATMLSHIPALSRFAPFIRHHHERWDGKGYPDGLRGETIPLYSRIISVVDTYDALTTNRTYQKAVGHEEACRILESCAGRQLDPHLVRTFLQVLSEKQVSPAESVWKSAV
jgi:hypothetical protein